ncbi:MULTISPECIES: hypothetical protein [Paenibacillus]|uniref:Core-binding (CB) domain-containing protein n=1 Tax=Paenibacillus polymyxa TaxID=1406 RepID=A0AAP4A1Y9_PAEPO|nr:MULTISPECIES: hypothetical protein [Paenibacillus]MDH2333758.1 hypothetical protein [Paenibacillus polymyxa]SFR22846.1 hypothetical protein SAMN04488603_1076 [Paenibacillus sp. cl130]
MKLKDLIDEFIQAKQNEQSRNVVGYYKDLGVFHDFLESKDVTEKNINEYLRGISTDIIIDCINYYITKNNVTSVSTVQRFVSAVKEFFVYIMTVGHVKNEPLLKAIGLPAHKIDSFRYSINKAVSDHPILKESGKSSRFTEEEIIDLINECNSVIQDVSRYAESDSISFNKLLSAIIYKLTIFTGIAYREIIDLPRTSYKENIGIITINEFSIHLPEQLVGQLNEYIYIRDSKSISTKLLIQFDGSDLPEKTSSRVTLLKEITGRGGLTGIIKYAITEMLKIDVNPKVIMNFTGVKDKIIEHCIETIYSESLGTSRYLDSKIRSLKIYEII